MKKNNQKWVIAAVYDTEKNKIYGLRINIHSKHFGDYKTIIYIGKNKFKRIKVITNIEFLDKAIVLKYTLVGMTYKPKTLVFLDNLSDLI